jgi:hypothetical protein
MLDGLSYKGPKLGKVPVLQCTNHNTCDPNQFLELKFDKYEYVLKQVDDIENSYPEMGKAPSIVWCPNFDQVPTFQKGPNSSVTCLLAA